jgi:hypothetical protein
MVTIMSVPVVEGLASHELAEVASVCSQTGNSDAHVVIDVEDLLLVASQIMWTLLQGYKNLIIESVNGIQADQLLVKLYL